MLPAARDTFVGRVADLSRIRERLAESRFVTISGAPGIGKTRVAVEYARAHEADYDQVVFVPLGAIAGLGPALAGVGDALEIELPPLPEDQLPAVVAEAIAQRGRCLIVLDNFEHLVDSASVLVDQILAGANAAHVLVTSRRRLRLNGEWVCELGALAPSEDAVTLLIDRVRRLRGEYSPSDQEREQLQQIAGRLEGLPMALELAAVRISTLGAATVLAHLDEPLRALGGDNLRRAIARSWDLLAASERAVLAACSAFHGGFDVEAAKAVASSDTILDALHDLCEKSLLSATARDDGTQRFQLYESIREFAASRLSNEERDSLHLRHAQHFVKHGEKLRAESAGRDAGDILDALAADRDNLLAAAARGLLKKAGVTPELGVRAALALVPLALARGPIAPLVERLDETLKHFPDLDLPLKIEIHLGSARGHRRLGNFEEARRHHAQALALAQDHKLLAQIKSDFAMTLISEGAMESAVEQLRGSLLDREEAKDRGGEALDRLRMAMALRELGSVEEAENLLHAAHDVFSAAGNSALLGITLAELAHTALDRRDYRTAAELLAEANTPAIRASSLLTDAAITARFGLLAHAQGKLDEAETYLQAVIIAFRRVGYRRFEAGNTGYLGAIDLELKRFDAARARLKQAREMLSHDQRSQDYFSGWLAVAEMARGDVAAAKRAIRGLSPLRPDDPASVATHILAKAVDSPANEGQLLADLSKHGPLNLTSHDVWLALKAVFLPLKNAADVQKQAGLQVAASGFWFATPDGARADCKRHRSLRLLLLELVEQRLLHPSRPVPRDRLIAVGWPGESIRAESARNRLKVAISSLRKMGLKELLLHQDEGYLLDARVPVVVISE